jgi:hypothetical protein
MFYTHVRLLLLLLLQLLLLLGLLQAHLLC